MQLTASTWFCTLCGAANDVEQSVCFSCNRARPDIAQNATPLKHPNLPRIYDHFTDADHWYLVMEFLEGETLERYLENHQRQRSYAGGCTISKYSSDMGCEGGQNPSYPCECQHAASSLVARWQDYCRLYQLPHHLSV